MLEKRDLERGYLLSLVEVESRYTAKDKILTGTIDDRDICLSILAIVTADFNPFDCEDYILHSDTYSFQIRPKALYKSKKGIYFKIGSSRHYLTEHELFNLRMDYANFREFLEI